MNTSQQIIDQTKKWINEVVIGCNFCPFAANVMKTQQVHYQVENSATLNLCLEALSQETTRLDNEDSIETIFLIFPNTFSLFDDYLDMLSLAEEQLEKSGYDGIYQLAGFHPLYQFADSSLKDAANYTNRSVYPMLHLLREESISNALDHYKNPEAIPERNINFAREKGLVYMKMLRDNCLG